MEHTGRYGSINGVGAMRNWSINEGFTTVKSVASNTQHGTNRNQGIYDWSGQYAAYGHTPAAMPGEYLTLSAYKAPDAADDIDNGELFGGSVLVGSVAITWNFATNEPISHVVQFGGNGALSVSAGSPPADAASVAEFRPCDGKIAYFESPTVNRIAHVTQAVLTFTREMKTSVNSGTSTGSGSCTTIRKPGAAIDWTLAITTEDGNEVAALASGQIKNLRAYVDATDFWDLKWGIFGQRSGLQVDRETGNVISQTHNAEMKGFNSGVGNITKPGAGSAWWPAA